MKVVNCLMSVLLVGTQVACTVSDKPEVAPVPYAVFEMDKQSCVGSCEVVFTNKSTNAESYAWDFGDNKTSTEKDPKHLFASPGEYKVVLKATGKGGTVETSKLMIVEKPIAQAVVSAVIVEQVNQKKPDGTNWDTSSDPDIFITIVEKGTSTEAYKQPNALQYVNTLAQMYPLTHTLATPIALSIAKEYTVNVYDDDGNTKELMGSADFKLSEYATTTPTFPSKLTKQSSNAKVSLNVAWAK